MNKFQSLSLTLLCVAMIATGQILFKAAAMRAATAAGKPLLEQWVSAPLIVALAIYGIATILWIWVLQHVQLGIAYPVFALAFFIVPVLAHLFLGEALTIRHLLGGLLIFAGILVATQA
jgi:undecaprenyl phosphate-alpha-L-ara4N flippase subunit ArnE